MNITPREAHEYYLQLTDIQTRLESDVKSPDESEKDFQWHIQDLERQKQEIRDILAESGYDPDNEPEDIWPENTVNKASARTAHSQTGYVIYGYDKDDDRYDRLIDVSNHVVNNELLMQEILKDVAKLVRQERILTEKGQPYDWVELRHHDIRIDVKG